MINSHRLINYYRLQYDQRKVLSFIYYIPTILAVFAVYHLQPALVRLLPLWFMLMPCCANTPCYIACVFQLEIPSMGRQQSVDWQRQEYNTGYRHLIAAAL